MPSSLSLLSEAEIEGSLPGSGNVREPGSLPGLRGYEVMAIVLCLIITAAIFMCYLTWRFRYKIVLRTRVRETTVVQNLVALTLQEISANDSGIKHGRNSLLEHYPNSQFYSSDHPHPLSGSTVPHINISSREPADSHSELTKSHGRSLSEGAPAGVIAGRLGLGVQRNVERSISESKSEGEGPSPSAGQRVRCESYRSADSDIPEQDLVQLIQERIREPRNRGRGRYRSNSLPYGKRKRKNRALVLSAVKLSSGQSVPKRIDPNKLIGISKEHPLSPRDSTSRSAEPIKSSDIVLESAMELEVEAELEE